MGRCSAKKRRLNCSEVEGAQGLGDPPRVDTLAKSRSFLIWFQESEIQIRHVDGGLLTFRGP